MFRFSIPLFFLFNLILATGCQQGPKGSPENTSYVTYNESEFAKDFHNIELAEQGLISAGLKFKRTEDSTNEVSTFVWDADALKKGASDATQQMALKSFIEMGELFLTKYSQPFFVNLEKEKTTLFRQIKPSLQVELQGKLMKAKSSLVDKTN